MARRSSSQLRAKNAAPMASSTAAAFQGDAARNCPKAARASTAARPAEVVPSQLISGTLPKISTSGTVTEIRMVQNLFSR